MTVDKKGAAKRMLEQPDAVTCPACDGKGFGRTFGDCQTCQRMGLVTRAEAAAYLLTPKGLVFS